ncbi:hypothetical protein KUK83_000150 [Vibrio parahaemolyticus]|nr:hypothetical protein [Vibrio parahaemolyticus]
MNTTKIKRSDAIKDMQKEVAGYLNSENDCTSQPLLFDVHYRNLYSSKTLPNIEVTSPTDTKDKEELREIVADMKRCNNPHDRYLISQYPSRFEMGNPLQLIDATPEKLRQYLVDTYGKSSASPESFNLSDQIEKVLTLFSDGFALMIKKDLKREKSRYRGSIYKLIVLNHKLSLVNRKWADLVKAQPIDLKGRILPSTIDNHLSFNVTNKKKSVENSTLIDTYLTELVSPTPGHTTQLSEFIKMLPLALQILEDDIKYKTLLSFRATENKFDDINVWLGFYKKKLNEVPPKIYINAHHEVLDHLNTQAHYNLRRNKFIGQYKLLKDLECNSRFSEVIAEIIREGRNINTIERPKDDKEKSLADVIAKILNDTGDASLSIEGKNVAILCAKAITKLGSLKISGYTQGNTNPAYSLRAMFNHIINHYELSDKASPSERLGSVPPSTLYLLILLRDAIYWGYAKEVDSNEKFFEIEREIIKNSLKYYEFIRKFKFYNVLVLSSNLWINEKNIICPCGKNDCTCVLEKHFFSINGGFETMLSEHLERVLSSPEHDPLLKYESLCE